MLYKREGAQVLAVPHSPLWGDCLGEGLSESLQLHLAKDRDRFPPLPPALQFPSPGRARKTHAAEAGLSPCGYQDYRCRDSPQLLQ